jgi:hypothetical protein
MQIVLREQQNFVACLNQRTAIKGGDMTQQALVISKDLVNELKRLAVLASKDDVALEEARMRYVRAGEGAVSTSSTFAIALYDFALRYADQPRLVEAKLDEMGIQYKRSSSVYVKIARLAFDDTRDSKGEVSRTRVSRYASIIEAAHAAGRTADEFKKSVERGITQALRKLRDFGKAKDDSSIELGREIASSLVGKRTFAIEQFPLPENVTEGDDVELIARVEGGKLVVYGVLPPDVSNVRSVLSKLGTPSRTEAGQLGKLLPDMLRSIKLVTGSQDADAKALYDVQGGLVRFAVFGSKADALLVAPANLASFGMGALTLEVGEWRRIIETLNPLRNQIAAVSVEGGQIGVQFDEQAVPDLDNWFEKNGKPKKIGISDGAALHIEVQESKVEHDYLSELKWTDAVSVTEKEIKPLLDFKPTKKLVAIAFASAKLQPTASDKPLKDHINLGRKTLSVVQGAVKKMLRLCNELQVDRADGYMRMKAKYDDGIELSLVVQAE